MWMISCEENNIRRILTFKINISLTKKQWNNEVLLSMCNTTTYLWFCWIYSRQKSSELINVIGVLRRLRRIRSLMRRRLFTLGHVQTRSMPRKKSSNDSILILPLAIWREKLVRKLRLIARLRLDRMRAAYLTAVSDRLKAASHHLRSSNQPKLRVTPMLWSCQLVWVMNTGKLNVSNTFQADTTKDDWLKSISNGVINGVFFQFFSLSKCYASSC